MCHHESMAYMYLKSNLKVQKMVDKVGDIDPDVVKHVGSIQSVTV